MRQEAMGVADARVFCLQREEGGKEVGVLTEAVGGRARIWKRTGLVDSNFSGK